MLQLFSVFVQFLKFLDNSFFQKKQKKAEMSLIRNKIKYKMTLKTKRNQKNIKQQKNKTKKSNKNTNDMNMTKQRQNDDT